jgi:hypothetical protein
MGLPIIGGTSGTNADVDTTPKALRSILYGPDGTPVVKQDRTAIVPGTTSGEMIAGADYKIARLLRLSQDGSLRGAENTLFLYDECEGAAVDTNKWIQTTTTQTITQSASVVTFNAGSSVAITTGAMQVSQRFMPTQKRCALVFRSRLRMTQHFAGNQIQFGWGAPTSVTGTAVPNGWFFRKDATGQILPVLSVNGSETLGTPISDVTFRVSVATTDYCDFEIFLESWRAVFRITTATGAVVMEQTLETPAASSVPQATHNQVFHQCLNTAATGTAVQLLVDGTTVMGLEGFGARGADWGLEMAGQSYSSATSPTAYTQAANYANSAAPASATLSNTAAGYTTLGGQWQFVAVAGAETDYALFGFTVPSPLSLVVTGVHIAAFNMGAAVATTPTLLQWAIAVNSSAVSLATAAPYSPMRVTLGSQSFAVGAAIGTNAPDVVHQFKTPLVCFPGRQFHVILKMPVGTATASQIIRGTCLIEGYFE